MKYAKKILHYVSSVSHNYRRIWLKNRKHIPRTSVLTPVVFKRQRSGILSSRRRRKRWMNRLSSIAECDYEDEDEPYFIEHEDGIEL